MTISLMSRDTPLDCQCFAALPRSRDRIRSANRGRGAEQADTLKTGYARSRVTRRYGLLSSIARKRASQNAGGDELARDQRVPQTPAVLASPAEEVALARPSNPSISDAHPSCCDLFHSRGARQQAPRRESRGAYHLIVGLTLANVDCAARSYNALARSQLPPDLAFRCGGACKLEPFLVPQFRNSAGT